MNPLYVMLLGVMGQDMCDMTLDGGVCIFNDETVLVPDAVQSGLVGRWNFEGKYALDSSGNGNHAL